MSFQPNTTAKQSLTAFISIGANQPSWAGDERQTIAAVLPLLQELALQPLALSSLYKTDPVDCLPGTQDFTNAVAKLQICSTLTPVLLLDKLQELEKHFGRQRSPGRTAEHNGPRPLDLDLIYYGGKTLVSERLVLPHPRAKDRLFVLIPLRDLCSQLDLGASTTNLSKLIHLLPKSPGLRRDYP